MPPQSAVPDVRHVGHEQSAVLVGNLSEACVVEVTRVTAHTGNDELRLEQGRALLQAVVVD